MSCHFKPIVESEKWISTEWAYITDRESRTWQMATIIVFTTQNFTIELSQIAAAFILYEPGTSTIYFFRKNSFFKAKNRKLRNENEWMFRFVSFTHRIIISDYKLTIESCVCLFVLHVQKILTLYLIFVERLKARTREETAKKHDPNRFCCFFIFYFFIHLCARVTYIRYTIARILDLGTKRETTECVCAVHNLSFKWIFYYYFWNVFLFSETKK